jgi:adenosylhomocysteine nucleosidase
MNITLITAMESEFNAVAALFPFTGTDKQKSVTLPNGTLTLLKSGIGKVNAALAAQKACDNGAELIITTGLAGGIDDRLEQGDIVLAEQVCYHDVWCGEPNAVGQVQDLPLYFSAPKELIQKITSRMPKGYLTTGLTVTGDVFLTDKTKLTAIKQTFPSAFAVDMESAAIAQVCYLNQTPFLSLRIISDVVGKPKQEEEYNAFWHNVPDKAAEMVRLVLESLH